MPCPRCESEDAPIGQFVPDTFSDLYREDPLDFCHRCGWGSGSLGKPVLVGECNPYGNDDEYALFPLPVGCAGWRLCHKILALPRRTYLKRFERTNLVQGTRWSMPAARERAQELQRRVDASLVLFGSKVAQAFGYAFAPLSRPTDRVLILPHPSGRCRMWSTPGLTEAARFAVRSLAGADLVSCAEGEDDDEDG